MTTPSDFPWRAGTRVLPNEAGGNQYSRVLLLEHGVPDGIPVLIVPESKIRVCRHHGPWIEAWNDDAGNENDVPDLTDPATLGALLGAVREAYRDPSMYLGPCRIMHPDGTSARWFVYTGLGKGPVGSGETEAEALLAAWAARPTVPR